MIPNALFPISRGALSLCAILMWTAPYTPSRQRRVGYRYWFDPFWVRAQPYRLALRPGQSAEVALHLRNFQRDRQRFRIEPHAPAGLVADVSVFEDAIEGESRKQLRFRLKATHAARPGVHIVAFDVTLDGRRYGERFDLIVGVESASPLLLRGVDAK
jgi:hypothetical protein